MSASGANIGLVYQCHLTFKLGNKYFTDKFIVLKDLWRNLILGLNWQPNYQIDATGILMDINTSYIAIGIYVLAHIQ